MFTPFGFLAPLLGVSRSIGDPIPVLDLDNGTPGINATGQFNEGASSTLYLEDATLTDARGQGIGSLTMTAGGGWGDDGADESIAFDTWTTDSETNKDATLVVGGATFRLVFVASTGVLTATNNAGTTFSAAEGQALIRLFEYANSAVAPSEISRTFTWIASDVPVTPSPAPAVDIYQVRRTSDDTLDTFTLTEVDDGTLATFVGGGDGAVPTWYDDSGNDNHVTMATTTNQPKVALSGSVQEGVVFQASDYLDLGARLTSGTVSALSIALWLKAADAASARNIACEMTTVNSWRFRLNSSGALELYRHNGSASSTVTSTAVDLDDGTWKHIVVVADGANIKFYVNGTLSSEEPADIVAFAQSGSTLFELGADRVFATLNGSMSDFRLWQSALTAGNVTTVHGGGEVGSPLIHLKGNYAA